MRRWIIVTMVLCLANIAQAEEMTYNEALSGSSIPLSIKAKDLGPNWHHITATGPTDVSGTGNWLQMYYASMSGASMPGFFTQGKTVAISGETYLVAYKVETQVVDVATMMRGATNGNSPTHPKVVTPETPLLLALLNVRSLGNLVDIRPFDAARDIQAEATLATQSCEDNNRQSDSRLKQLGLGVMMYTQDYDDVLPPMASTSQFQMAVYPYVKEHNTFIDQHTNMPYGLNTRLSHHRLRSVPSPASMVLLFETKPAEDGTREVVFLNWRAQRIRETEWPRLKKACKIR